MSETPYVMPPITNDRLVWWYADANPSTTPTPAIVTSVGGRNVDLAIFHRGLIQHAARDGVMHVSDPRAQQHHGGSGAWDYTPQDKQLMELQKIVDRLQAEWDTKPTEKKKAA